MKFKKFALASMASAVALSASLMVPAAQAAEQFLPILSYRTGAYGPVGTPFANGVTDYYKLINAQGGINGVKIKFEECDFGYDTARGVECYERLKADATVVHPMSTGVTIAVTAKAPETKVPVIAAGYGPSEAMDGGVYKWNFPLMGTYVHGADALLQHFAKLEGGIAKLKGKKIAYVYHDSGYGKEPIPYLEQRAAELGFNLTLLPVPHPGLEQKSTWLKIRQLRPDYTIMWAWGVQTSTALKEALATGYPLNKLYGNWWAGSEVDTADLGMRAKGYNSLALGVSTAYGSKIANDILKNVYDKGQGTGDKAQVGSVLHTRGVTAAALTVEAIRTAQAKYGKGKVITGEQMRWGLENLNVDEGRIKAMGFEGLLSPISTSCADHNGGAFTRIQTWDGKQWAPSTGWIEPDQMVVKPYLKAAADKYAASKGIQRRGADDCQ